MVNKQFQKSGVVLLVVAGLISIMLLVGAGQREATAVFHHSLPPANTPEGWTVECIDCLPYFTGMSGNSAALDSSGRVRTTYGGDSLYYAIEIPDGSYQTEIVDPNPRRGVNATMVLDSSDQPHILYYAEDLLRLNYASNDGGLWYIESLPTGDITAPPHPWLVIDSSDNLHVTFNDANRLIYGFYDQNAWQFATVDTETIESIGRPSLTLDSDDRPHIAYSNGRKYAYYDGFDWQFATFAGYLNYGGHVAITLDQADKPHIVFQADYNIDGAFDLLYRYKDGPVWKLEIIDLAFYRGNSYVGDDISLTLDAVNSPVVAYTAQHTSEHPYPWYDYYLLRFAYRDSAGWNYYEYYDGIRPIYDTHYSTLLSGPEDKLTIVYKDGIYLKRKVLDDGTVSTSVIEQGGITGTYNDLTIDDHNRIHVSTHEAELDGLRYALKENDAWSVEKISNRAGFKGSDWTSIAVTAYGYPHIMFDRYGRFGAMPYAYFDGQDWFFEDLYDNDGLSYAVGIDGADQFHVVYHDNWFFNDFDGLSHLSRDPDGNWNEATWIDPNMVEGQLDLILDPTDFPHIAYPATDGLRYAYNTPSGWFTTTVTSGNVDFPSLALDRDNQPHIAWYDITAQDLRYATYNGTTWQVATLDSDGDVGQFASLAVDRLGRVYIAYYDAGNQDLKYAVFDGSTWTTTTLLHEGDIGAFSKLVMPYAGYPAIAYYDAVTRDLMLIYRPFTPTNFSYMPIFLAAGSYRPGVNLAMPLS